MNRGDSTLLTSLLTDTVTVLCRNSIKFLSNLKVQGLLVVTADESETYVIEINDTFSAADSTETIPAHNKTIKFPRPSDSVHSSSPGQQLNPQRKPNVSPENRMTHGFRRSDLHSVVSKPKSAQPRLPMSLQNAELLDPVLISDSPDEYEMPNTTDRGTRSALASQNVSTANMPLDDSSSSGRSSMRSRLPHTGQRRRKMMKIDPDAITSGYDGGGDVESAADCAASHNESHLYGGEGDTGAYDPTAMDPVDPTMYHYQSFSDVTDQSIKLETDEHLNSFVTNYTSGDDEAADEGADEFYETGDDGVDRNFSCEYAGCTASFQHQRSLVRHQRSKHGARFGTDHQIAFYCNMEGCRRPFYARATLAKHMKSAHGIAACIPMN